MNFLALVNRTRVECGVSGPALPTTTGLSGEAQRVANWVNAAWVDVQSQHEDWEFLRTPVEFTTTANQQTYTAAEAGVGATFGNWKRDSFRCSSVGANYADEQLLNYMEFTTFRNLYQYGNMRTTYARPVVVSVTPGKDLAFGSIPDQPYVITGEYYTAPAEFTSDTDEPGIPARFQMIIVYRAMMYYAGYEAAAEVFARGEQEFKRLMNRLEIDQMQTVTSGPPLA